MEHGSTVIISSSNPDKVNKTLSRLTTSYPSAKSRVSGHTVDLSDEDTLDEQIKALLDKATANGSQKLDHIVFTAADSLAMLDLNKLEFATVKKAGMLRFFAPLFIAKHAPKYMHANSQSSIVLTSGGVGERPIPGWAVINSYATGLQGMTRGLALDLKPIRVNLVSPGGVETELWDGIDEGTRKGLFESMKKGTTTGAVAQPEQVAEAYLYLMRDGNCVGEMVSTDGGSLLLGPH